MFSLSPEKLSLPPQPFLWRQTQSFGEKDNDNQSEGMRAQFLFFSFSSCCIFLSHFLFLFVFVANQVTRSPPFSSTSRAIIWPWVTKQEGSGCLKWCTAGFVRLLFFLLLFSFPLVSFLFLSFRFSFFTFSFSSALCCSDACCRVLSLAVYVVVEAGQCRFSS